MIQSDIRLGAHFELELPLGIGGDLIQAVDGIPVETSDVLKHAMGKKRAGDTIELAVLSPGREPAPPLHSKLRSAS